MSTYKKEVGTAVQNFAGDYTGAVQGQLWYNSTAGSFQFRSLSTVGAWSTGNSINAAKAYMGSVGTQTAALSSGGVLAPFALTNQTESYDGTSWTEVNDMNTARWQLATGGTQTSAISFGGATGFPAPTGVNNSESWNGTSWTATNTLTTARRLLMGVGSDSTAAIAFGGFNPGPAVYANTESWNGTSWTEVNDLNTARRDLGGCGNETSALAIGGQSPDTGATEEWNGTSWTTLPATLNQARGAAASSKISTSSALFFGGDIAPGRTGLTELYNGTSWSETTDLSQIRRNLGGAGTSTAALAYGGEIGPITAVTEEWLGAGAPVTETITTS
jgi:hypothetical protein